MFLFVGILSFSCKSKEDKEYKILNYNMDTKQTIVPIQSYGRAVVYDEKVF
ncbi:MAG: hypothetical protein LBV55_02345 [Acholeplasmatales bacterium]|jgi:hypothetical protein|nr:hypothetical protein [Acholeplasmatales bacterium]